MSKDDIKLNSNETRNQNSNEISIDEISKYIKQNGDIFKVNVLDVWNAKIVYSNDHLQKIEFLVYVAKEFETSEKVVSKTRIGNSHKTI